MGKANAKLKLLAGILGINYDDLRQREKRRQFWQRTGAVAVGLALATLIGSVWYHGHLEAEKIERAHNLRLAQLMVQKAKDAVGRRDEAAAIFYGAHAIKHSLLAHVNPLEDDLLASLSP